MANISYFQRYSQRENHATNNTLLVMRHFYQVSPQKISVVLSELCEKEMSVGLLFEQQLRSANSIPDALISQAPLDIYFETKRGRNLDLSQIDRHLDSINRNRNHAQKFLFGLTKEQINDTDRRKILQRVKEKSKNVTFVPITFEKIVQSLRFVCEKHETELCEILSDYVSYLESENLLPTGQILSAFAVGDTFDENVKHRLYFEPFNRPSKEGSSFIGLYRNKRIEQLASFDTVVVRDNVDGDFIFEKGNLSDEERERIQRAIEDDPTLVDQKLRYYLFGELYNTNFIKRSKGGMRGYRKFYLSEWLDYGNTEQYSAQEVAQHLMDQEWK